MKVKCSVCGKITAGRLPRRTRHDIGDGTFWYPRRHKCVGDIQEGLLVDEHLLTKRALDGAKAPRKSKLSASSPRK